MEKLDYIKALIRANFQVLRRRWKSAAWIALAMCLQNLIWLGLWAIFFARFRNAGGWTFADVAVIFSVGSAGYCPVSLLFLDGMFRLGPKIATRDFDASLVQPRGPLLFAILREPRLDALGDLGTGLVCFFVLAGRPLADLPLFIVMAGCASMVWFGFVLLTQCLVFWRGEFAKATDQIFEIGLILGTMPQQGLPGPVRLFLLTVLPLGLIAYLPAGIVQHFNWAALGYMLAVSGGFAAFAVWVFRLGVRRYVASA